MVTQNPFVQYGKEIWWMILIRGIFGVIFGIIALVWPGITVVALVFLFGIYSIADGLITIVRAIRDREHLSSWGWWVFTGVVSVGAGIVALVWPGITALVLLYIIAFYAIMFGIFGIVRSEEHTSELQSLMRISYAVFCLKKKKKDKNNQH